MSARLGLAPVPDGVYPTFVMRDGQRHERCRAQVEDGPSRWDRLSNSLAHPKATCPNPTDGGRFCEAHQ